MAKVLQDAIKDHDGYAAVGRLMGVSRQLLWHWANIGSVPAERVGELSELVGIPKHTIRPDVFAAEPVPVEAAE